MSNYTGILDPQPGNLAFALFDGDALIFNVNCPMHGRDAAILPDFIAEKLADKSLKINDFSDLLLNFDYFKLIDNNINNIIKL
jgi:hypothetical protein